MNFNKGINLSRWEGWGALAFFVYCVSTIFMVFFSTTAVQIWPYPWNRLSILIACLLPLLLVFVWKIPRLIRDRKLEKQFIFIPIIVILGILNIVFSEDRPTTFKVMTLFIISGVGIFLTTGYLLNTKFRQKICLWLCLACLLSLCIYGILEYINKEPILLFSYNPIPAGSLLILLFVGPLLLFSSNLPWQRFLKILSIIFGMVVIVMIGKRGPILGLLVMAILFCALLPGRKLWIIPIIALILAGTAYKTRNYWRSPGIYIDKSLRISKHGPYSYRISAYVKGKGQTDLYIWWYDVWDNARNKYIGRYNLSEDYQYLESVFKLPKEAEELRIAFLLREKKDGLCEIYIDDFVIEEEAPEVALDMEVPRNERARRPLFTSDFENAKPGKPKSLGWWTYSEGRPINWPWGLTSESHKGRHGVYLRQPDSKNYWLYTGMGPLVPFSLTKYLITGKSTVFRLENFTFAAHIFLKKPLFGIGLHAPLTDYLSDYRQKITKNRDYPKFIQNKKTLENIILCGFVEMGGLFTITYIALIIYLLRNLFRLTKDRPDKRQQVFLFLIPLIGFLIHSMTFDSLIYPHINWLFHSFLGLMANFDKI